MPPDAVCIVTGGTSGIGREVALLLARAGVAVTIVGRHASRAAATVADLRLAGARSADAVIGDLSSQRDVRRMAGDLLGRHARIGALVNNAGALFLRRQQSADGLEMTWALNHLSYFLLTTLLLDRLIASAPARVVNVASEAHAHGRIRFDDPCAASRAEAYAQSKLANVLFTRALARRLAGTGVTANAVHPGRVDSGFGANNGWIWTVARPFVHRHAIAPPEAAPAVAALVLAPELEGVSGRYFDRGHESAPGPQATDENVEERLWVLSECMVDGSRGQ
jgi:retinol dehydrogenase 12